jgi:DNA repair protein RecN (Recombination protein N)
LNARVESLKIELDDIVSELETANDSVAFNPNEIEQLNDRLQLIYSLQKKHYVSTISDLLNIKVQLGDKVAQVENSTEQIKVKENEINSIQTKLDKIATTIHSNRKKALPSLKKQLEGVLENLGMPNAQFNFNVKLTSAFFPNGKDQLQFLFAANKGTHFGELKKVASGGELSRIMLSIKLILSKYTQLPTIIFDEIDTGVSGEVSTKIADVMEQMSINMQVVTITHLPQIAAKGSQHYKVFKQDIKGKTATFLKRLNDEERVKELAEMLGGKNITESAIQHAKQLLV